MNRDPFSVLGVSPSATEDEIKTAYRRLAKQYHPDLNPGDQFAEAKMKEINEAYTEAIRLKKAGETWRPDMERERYGERPYGNDQNSYGQPFGSYQQYGQWSQDPFSSYNEFNPFEQFFRSAGSQATPFRTRNYFNPELKTVEQHLLAQRFHDALNLLNRIPQHGADWHALYARADIGLGNRISALDHARKAVQMAPDDEDYQLLLRAVESGRRQYERTRQNGYDFRSAVCSNPFVSCCAVNLLCNCCLGGRFGFCC